MRARTVRIAVAVVALGTVHAVVALAAGPFQYHSVTPCRILDTRLNPGPTNQNDGQPLPNPGPHLFRIQGFCGVPDGAAAVSLNASVIQPNRNGDLRLFPSNVGSPLVATMSYNAFELALSNGAIVPLAPVNDSGDTDLAVQHAMPTGPGGLMHLTVDVTGYFQ